jgi:hypothetical protein
MMELSKRTEQLEDEKAQLEGRLSMLEREEMVQNSYTSLRHSGDALSSMALTSSGSIETKMKSSLSFVEHASMYSYDIKDSALSSGQRQVEGPKVRLGDERKTTLRAALSLSCTSRNV